MSGDALREILDAARRDQPDVAEEIWQRFEATVRTNFGGLRPYIAAHKKRQHLAAIERAAPGESSAHLAIRLGVSERRVRQYKQLMGGK